jgi:hypothetical protein
VLLQLVIILYVLLVIGFDSIISKPFNSMY